MLEFDIEMISKDEILIKKIAYRKSGVIGTLTNFCQMQLSGDLSRTGSPLMLEKLENEPFQNLAGKPGKP